MLVDDNDDDRDDVEIRMLSYLRTDIFNYVESLLPAIIRGGLTVAHYEDRFNNNP